MYHVHFHNPIPVHFIGIGGISMSGLAEILLKEGFPVSGSDSHASALTEHLERAGARICIGQEASNIPEDCKLVVYTAAIHPDNPEYREAKRRGVPMLSRAELLGQLMRNYQTSIAVAGTHGKTTTTSMIASILLEEDADPTISVGGILPSIGGNIRVGGSEMFLTEACEYTNSFLHFFPPIGIILNIEEDHMDFFKDLNDIRRSFRCFAELLPVEGLLIINSDIPNYEEITEGLSCRVVTFGSSPDADYRAENTAYDTFGHPSFDLIRKIEKDGRRPRFSLKVPGEHNVCNALASIALADALRIPEAAVEKGLLSFTGTDRRFQYKGEVNGVTIIDDYAHHPAELTATLATAKKMGYKRVIAVHQPFTYSRTKMLMDDFAAVLRQADQTVLLPIMGGREEDDGTVTSQQLAAKIPGSIVVDGLEGAANWVKQNAGEGDLVVCMSCGDLYKAADLMVQ